MLKRISGLIGFVILSFTVATYAQLAVGDWQIYTSTGTPVKVIDTPQRVYYVSGRSLFGFDKETEEMESYSKNNILNDIDIANIYYNYDKKYLVIVYANSNVDILHDNGKVFNIPDIKNAILTTAKGINDVKFYGEISGKIIRERRGSSGFGYDSVFVPEGYEETFAEMGEEEKNKISHRARAVKKLSDFFNTL